MLRLVLIIFLILLIIGMLPMWPHATTWGLGWYPSGGLALLLIILVVVFLAAGPGDRRLVR